MESEKLIESVKFLLKSVQKLGDKLVESNQGVSDTFKKVCSEITGLKSSMRELKEELVDIRDKQLIGDDSVRKVPDLPISEDQRSKVFTALHLLNEAVLEVYRNMPALLEPFARPCSVSGKTLSGELNEVELEFFAQGITWIIELQKGDWALVTRPEVLLRQTQLDGLSRIFNVISQGALPGEIELLSFSTAIFIEHGRRWYLKGKGAIGVLSNSLEHSLESGLRWIEYQLKLLHVSSGD